jgi:hypothetical protein
MHCICIENDPTALAARSDRLDESANNDANDAIDTLQISHDPTSMRREWPHEITETIILYLLKINWRTPFLWRLRSTNTQWKIAIESVGWKAMDLSSCSQGSIQPRNSFRLGLFRDAVLIVENCRVYETVHDAAFIPHSTLDSPGSRDWTLRGPAAQ